MVVAALRGDHLSSSQGRWGKQRQYGPVVGLRESRKEPHSLIYYWKQCPVSTYPSYGWVGGESRLKEQSWDSELGAESKASSDTMFVFAPVPSPVFLLAPRAKGGREGCWEGVYKKNNERNTFTDTSQ